MIDPFDGELVQVEVGHLLPENGGTDGVEGRTEVYKQDPGVRIGKVCVV